MNEVWGTLLFHNFLALKGVTDSLHEGGMLAQYARPQLPLLATMVAATLLWLAIDLWLRGHGRKPGVT
jgi:hypothetical protein